MELNQGEKWLISVLREIGLCHSLAYSQIEAGIWNDFEYYQKHEPEMANKIEKLLEKMNDIRRRDYDTFFNRSFEGGADKRKLNGVYYDIK